jgi:predicted membrane protein
MGKGLNFTPEEEAELEQLTRIEPKNFGQRLAMIADKYLNTITMFFILLTYSIVGYVFFKRILDQLLYISNVYQLVALPLLGVATGLSTLVIIRFLFRIFLELREDNKRQQNLQKVQLEQQAEIVQVQQETAATLQEVKDMHQEVHALVLEVHRILRTNGGVNVVEEDETTA